MKNLKNVVGLLGLLLGVALLFIWTPDLDHQTLSRRYDSPLAQTLEVDGLAIHYVDSGPRDAPVLLLLHGFGSSLQTWDVWAQALEKKYRVIRLDLPGFGLTGASPVRDYSEQQDLQTLTHFVEKLQLRAFGLVGHSMGGKMAWALAAAEPSRVKALVLMAPDGFPTPDQLGTRPYAMPGVMGFIKFVLPTFLVRQSIEPAFENPKALSEALVSRYADMLRAPGVRQAILDRGQQTVYTDPVPRLKSIQAPTLLLWGAHDQMIPSRNAQSYAAVLPNAQIVVLPQGGHLLQEEKPEIALKVVDDFLATQGLR